MVKNQAFSFQQESHSSKARVSHAQVSVVALVC